MAYSEFLDTEYVSGSVGKIVNAKAEEGVLAENGSICFHFFVDSVKLLLALTNLRKMH